MNLVAIAVVLSVLLSPALSVAQSPDCLRPVWSHLKPNDGLSIFKRDGSTISGKLATVDLDRDIVSLSSTGGNVPGNITIPASDIWQIEYKKAGKIQGWWAVAGLAVGGLIGAGAGAATYDENDPTAGSDSRSEAALKGAAIGAAGGLLLGTILSPFFPSKRTVVCEDPTDPNLSR
jgi:hypothetical protein